MDTQDGIPIIEWKLERIVPEPTMPYLWEIC